MYIKILFLKGRTTCPYQDTCIEDQYVIFTSMYFGPLTITDTKIYICVSVKEEIWNVTHKIVIASTCVKYGQSKLKYFRVPALQECS